MTVCELVDRCGTHRVGGRLQVVASPWRRVTMQTVVCHANCSLSTGIRERDKRRIRGWEEEEEEVGFFCFVFFPNCLAGNGF